MTKLFPKADLSPYQVVQFLGSITAEPLEPTPGLKSSEVDGQCVALRGRLFPHKRDKLVAMFMVKFVRPVKNVCLSVRWFVLWLDFKSYGVASGCNNLKDAFVDLFPTAIHRCQQPHKCFI